MTEERGELTPSEAFAVLGDETRVAILETLAEAMQSGDVGVSFSELRKRTDIRDAGQFNYHLSKLRDRFVVKRDDGYYPRYAALQAVGAIRSGTYTDALETRTAESEVNCPDCGEPLTVEYENGFFSLTCEDHEKIVQTFVPPSVAENRTLPELTEYVHAEVQRDLERAIDGVCPICQGPVAVADRYREDENRLHAMLNCDSCWLNLHFPIPAAVVRHPAVVALYHDHGIDVRTRPLMSLDFARDPDSVTVLDEDPFRARVDVTLGDDSVALTLDEDLNVVEVEEHRTIDSN